MAEHFLKRDHWHIHPAVRSDSELTLGERAADRMRNGFGSWTFIGTTLVFIALWIVAVHLGFAIDNHQLTILNLVLSCFAALQGAIILLAAKRADKISSELAQHDFEADTISSEILKELKTDFAEIKKVLHEQFSSRAE